MNEFLFTTFHVITPFGSNDNLKKKNYPWAKVKGEHEEVKTFTMVQLLRKGANLFSNFVFPFYF